MFNKKKRAANLMESGLKGVGTVMNVQDTGTTINENPRVVITFSIAPLDGSAAFEGRKKATVSRTAIPQAGQRYPIWFDAEDPTEFAYATIDGGAEARQQIVAIFGDAFGPDGAGVGQVAVVAAPAPAAPDPIDQLAKLDQMRQSGALSEEEFAAQKQRVLSGG